MDTSRSRRRRGPARAAATGTALAAAAVACVAAHAIALGTAWAAPAAAAGTITTIAGGTGGPGPARSTSIEPCGPSNFKIGCGLAFTGGRLYFTDNAGQTFNAGVVRSVSMIGGKLTTVAGAGVGILAGDGGPALQAGLLRPDDVSFDHAGNMLISNATSVRVVATATGTFYGQAMTGGHIYTVAGGGASTQNGVPATTAAISPQGAIVDQAGNIVICGSRAIRVIAASSGTFYGQPMTTGDIYTVAGGGSSTADGISATAASIKPGSVVIGVGGNLLITDGSDTRLQNRVRLIAVTTGTFYGQSVTAGDIYTLAGDGHSLKEKVPANQTAMLPLGLAVDKNSNVIIADFDDNLVRVLAAKTGRFYGQAMKAGFIYAIAGGGTSMHNGVLAPLASLMHPVAVTTDSAGNVIVANQSFHLQALAARTGTFYGVHMTAGHLYAIAGNGQGWSSGSGGPATKAQFPANGPIAYDGGNLVISGDRPGHTSLHVKIRLVPSRAGTFFGQAMKAGHVYVIAGTDKPELPRSGIPGTSAALDEPDGLAVDAHGNLLIAEGRIDVLAAHAGTFYGQRMKVGFLYKIAGNGQFQDSGDGGPATKAGMNPGQIVVDGNGNVVLSDILRSRVIAARTGTFYGTVMTAGHIYTIAGDGTQGTSGDGGPAKNAEFTVSGDGLALDGNDGLLISDNNRIRMIATATGTFFGVAMTAGDIYTIAGTGTFGTSGDGGPALTSELSPYLLTVDKSGNLVLYDYAVNKIRVVPASSGTFYGQAMTADHLYSIAGGGDGSLGDGGPGTSASITAFVFGLAHGSQGIVFTDGDGIRVRLVTG